MQTQPRAAVPAQPAEQRASLVVGNLIRCPQCEQLRDPLNPQSLRRLDRPEKYQRELNVVYKCWPGGKGCGHVFSPGDTWVMEAYLSGQLVPASHVNNNDNDTGGEE